MLTIGQTDHRMDTGHLSPASGTGGPHRSATFTGAGTSGAGTPGAGTPGTGTKSHAVPDIAAPTRIPRFQTTLLPAALLLGVLVSGLPALAQDGPAGSVPVKQAAPFTQATPITQATVDALLRELAAHDARIQELEQRLVLQSAGSAAAPSPEGIHAMNASDRTNGASGLIRRAVMAMPVAAESAAAPVAETPATVSAGPVATGASVTSDPAPDPHDHMLSLPGGGPALKFRGFFDFDYGMGSVANPLVFPLGAPAHDTFQGGEFDLFMSSKLSDHFSFVAELVVGSDHTNLFGVDLERYQLSYKANPYFEISAGRFHSAIGYYNTAYHHGTWFGTATGRPFMYIFEDSGGLLPVHNVGITATGLVPGTGRLALHWVAEVGNGRAGSPNAAEPVQNFLSDRNRKAANFAVYIKPEWLEGLQAGGSYYFDRLYPDGLKAVDQKIGSIYAVYFKSGLEFLNEGVWLQNRSGFNGRTYNTPMMYTQISHKIGSYVPYFRFQYVNAPVGDPVNVFAGRYEGPSFGVRYNVTDYAALKLQYNRVYGLIGNTVPANGLDASLGFTF